MSVYYNPRCHTSRFFTFLICHVEYCCFDLSHCQVQSSINSSSGGAVAPSMVLKGPCPHLTGVRLVH